MTIQTVLRWICARCPLNEQRERGERRKVSPEGRQRWEIWQLEKADVERRLELVDMQTKVIEHVTRAMATEDPGPVSH
jgi:hypothetical protein